MVPVESLWLPVVLSAGVSFSAGYIVYSTLGLHERDWRKVPGEDTFIDVLRQLEVGPGDYAVPAPGAHIGVAGYVFDPRFVERLERGPIVYMAVARGEAPRRLRPLFVWFGFLLLAAASAAWVGAGALSPGASVPDIARFVGMPLFMGHALGMAPDSIFFRRAWSQTLRNMADGLLYSVLSVAVFVWFWPAG